MVLSCHQNKVSKTYVFLGGVQDKSFELVEAIVDSGPSPLLHNWFVTLQMNQKVQMDRLVNSYCRYTMGNMSWSSDVVAVYGLSE